MIVFRSFLARWCPTLGSRQLGSPHPLLSVRRAAASGFSAGRLGGLRFGARSIVCLTTLVAFALCFATLGCTSSPYGYARVYQPLRGEETAARGAQAFDPIMAQRARREWIGKRVSVFGIVKGLEPATGGGQILKLSVRNLQPRNLCSSLDEDTCRVTVTHRQFTTLYARTKLGPRYLSGKDAVRPESLVRVIGTISEAVHKKSGNTLVISNFFRHWPAQTFVTTAARSYMRQ